MHPAADAGKPKILLVAGEASGDFYAGRLAQALKEQHPAARLLGLGGRDMRAAGVDVRYPLTELAVMGFVEVLARFGDVRRAWRAAVDVLDTERPDVIVLIDYPGFNLRLAEQARRRGIRVVYYISPQLWAWKPGRVRIVRRAVDRMLVILPFEEAWYRERNVQAIFVGHPLLDEIPAPTADPPRADPPRVALLPGSRASDWQRLFPVMAAAAETLARQLPGVCFQLPLASTASRTWLAPYTDRLNLELIKPDYAARAACDVALAKSGTCTIEHALLGLPTVIAYRTSPVTYALARRLVRVPHIGMVNLIAGREVCPEYIQHDATPQALAQALAGLLTDDDRRRAMRRDMLAVRAALGEPGASARAAGEVLKLI